MTNIDANDPNLTAYALGELDAESASAIEQQLSADAGLRAEVEAIRSAASMLRNGFAAEHAPGLTEAQRMAVQQKPQPVVHSHLRFRGRLLWIGSGLAAAACLTLAVLMTWNPLTRDGAGRFAGGPTTKEADKQDRGGVAMRGLREEEKKDETAHSFGLAQPGVSAGTADGSQLGMALAMESAEGLTPTTVRTPVNDALAASQSAGAVAGGSGASSVNVVTAPGSDASSPGDIRSNPTGSMIYPPLTPPPPSRPTEARVAQANSPESAGVRSTGVAGEDMARRIRALAESEAPFEGGVRSRLDLSKATDGRLQDTTRENYAYFIENEFLNPLEGDHALSTFSADVDTASFANMRRFLNSGQLPPKDSIRIEELINYFPYNYEAPTGDVPFSANIEVNQAPWKPEHRLVRIGLRGKDIKMDMRPATSIVFLIDVSGSMNQPNKLPYVKQSLLMLLEQLNGDDRLAIVTYAGNAGLMLDSTFCSHEKKPEIAAIINGLSAGGSTNGAGGINVAYDNAVQHHIKGGVNRVILCTDGDFNVGVSSEAELIKLIEEKRATGVYLSVLGFGTGNIQDAKMKQLSIHGNGNYAFIDRVEEGKRVLVDQLAGTLVTIAKDVKLQVEFNPAKVGAYRLIGYEQRVMAAQDFNNDLKDAGEIGAGHTVTALYEIIPPGDALAKAMPPQVDDLEFQKTADTTTEIVPSDLLLMVKIRYKDPDGDESKKLKFPVKDTGAGLNDASAEFKFASAVASFGMILRESAYKGDATLDSVMGWWESSLGPETPQQWHELSGLIQTAKRLQPQAVEPQPVEPQR